MEDCFERDALWCYRVIALKILASVQAGKRRRKSSKLGLIYGLGGGCSFPCLHVLAIGVNQAKGLGIGEAMFKTCIFVIAMTICFGWSR